LLLMKIETSPQSKSEGTGTQDLMDGLRYLFREKNVLGLVVMVAALSVVGFSYLTLLPVFAQDVLQIGAEGFGGLLAAQGAGALTAALSLAFRGDRLPKGRLLIYSRYLLAFAIFLLGFSRWVPLTMTALILAGFALISQLALTNTLLQLLVPDEFRGRVLSSYTWALGGFFPIGSLLIGSMGDAFGAANAVMISSGCSLILSIIGGIYFKEIRHLT
jgi:predicted MFS family arabinose efflux permease